MADHEQGNPSTEGVVAAPPVKVSFGWAAKKPAPKKPTPSDCSAVLSPGADASIGASKSRRAVRREPFDFVFREASAARTNTGREHHGGQSPQTLNFSKNEAKTEAELRSLGLVPEDLSFRYVLDRNNESAESATTSSPDETSVVPALQELCDFLAVELEKTRQALSKADEGIKRRPDDGIGLRGGLGGAGDPSAGLDIAAVEALFAKFSISEGSREPGTSKASASEETASRDGKDEMQRRGQGKPRAEDADQPCSPGKPVAVLDTNQLLNALDSVDAVVKMEQFEVCVPRRVVAELEGLQRDEECGLRARQAMRYLESCRDPLGRAASGWRSHHDHRGGHGDGPGGVLRAGGTRVRILEAPSSRGRTGNYLREGTVAPGPCLQPEAAASSNFPEGAAARRPAHPSKAGEQGGPMPGKGRGRGAKAGVEHTPSSRSVGCGGKQGWRDADDEILAVAARELAPPIEEVAQAGRGPRAVYLVTEDKGLRLRAAQHGGLRLASIGQLVSQSRETAQPRDLARVVTASVLAAAGKRPT